MTPAHIIAAQTCLTECTGHIARGENEGPIRSVFCSHLRAIVGSPQPWWAEEHILRTEAAMRIGRASLGFADNVVGLTAIEYEKNLLVPALYSTGLGQVHDYIAGLLNSGASATTVRGVLSDTVRWEAYEVVSISPSATVGSISRHDITLRQITRVDCSAATVVAARQMHQFLVVQLGRDGGQVLTADTLYDMLGVTSVVGADFVVDCGAVVDAAFGANPGYAAMVQRLWANFVSFVGTETAGVFDQQAYVHELYLLTLAKLIAANVLDSRAIISPINELQSILDGRYFTSRGLTNLVEYDYFGWLTRAPHITGLTNVAQEIQVALKAFDFSAVRPQDLFGRLVAQMAERTQRILLGQEPTPAWLVSQVVDAVDLRQPEGSHRRYVDPCCGSGAFVVDVVAKRAGATGFAALPRETRAQVLCEAIAGFDIDPLSVMLAKVSWLVAARPVLTPFDSSFPFSIPIYHADSLFATTPLSGSVAVATTGDFTLRLDSHSVTLPRFLTGPSLQAFFDEYAEGLYAAAQAQAGTATGSVTAVDVAAIRAAAESTSGTPLAPAEAMEAETFGLAFTTAMTALERDGRNGLWLYMLRNGYRPAMLKGQFSGIVTNFPWLALSRLANNPYKATLQQLTAAFNVQPPADCAHHLELATIFFLHAAEHYLDATGVIAGVVPSTVMQGAHHAALRSEQFRLPPSGLQLHIREVWSVDPDAFSTNVSAVMLATRGGGPLALSGGHVEQSGLTGFPLYLSTLGNKNAWTRVALAPGGHVHYNALQGADMMPRTTWFHEQIPAVGPGGAPFVTLAPIIIGASPRSYLIQIAHIAQDFAATSRTLSASWVFPILTSAHVVPFHTNQPADALLPLMPRSNTNRKLSSAGLAADRMAAAHFAEVFAELDRVWPASLPWNSAKVFGDKLNFRNKLTVQQFVPDQKLVVFGAGGKYPCAGALTVTPGLADRLVIDQTIYWFAVSDDNELDFVVGMLNSKALAETIRPFQPQGKNAERHVHKLAVAVLPQWNAANLAHQAVVQCTRVLRTELLSAAATNAKLNAALSTPTARVDVRRTVIRRHLNDLPSFGAYQVACWAVLPP